MFPQHSTTLADLLGNRRAARVLKGMWLALALVFLIDLVWLRHSGMRVAPPTSWLLFALPVLAIAGISLWIRPEPYVFMFMHAILQSIFGTLAMGWFCYLSTRLAMPLIDTRLIAADHALGFDWREWLGFVARHPLLQHILRTAYISESFEVFCIIWLLSMLKYPLEIERLLLALLIASVVTTVIANLLPALGGYVFYHIRPEMVLQYPAAGYIFKHDFMALRSHQLAIIPFPMQGLVKFPSFHVVATLLVVWISRCMKWWAFVPIALFNAIIIAACPTDGGHYLTDILGGVVAAAIVIFTVEKLLPFGLDKK